MCTLKIKTFILSFACACLSTLLFAQNDLPGPTSSVQLIKNGSWIIAMDTLYQKHPGYFNMKAYGMVNALLQHEIPVKWAIKAGKTRSISGSVDFTASVTRIYPDTMAMGNISFRSSAFIIDSSWISAAWPVITSFGNHVYVYRLDANSAIDIRYTLTHKPRILLLNSSGYDTTAVSMLKEAGFPPNTYHLQLPAGTAFNPAGNWTLLSESHWDSNDTSRINPILRYGIERGANIMMNCVALKSFENATFTMTTGGVDSLFTGWAGPTYLNHDLPVAQFIGTIATPHGDCKMWKEKPGSVFRPNTYEIMRGSGGNRLYTMAGMKMRSNSLAGGNLFYVAGHDQFFWTAPTGTINDPNKINGRRIFMNAIFIPVSDSIEDIDFKTDVVVSLKCQAGLAVKNENYKLYIIAKNQGPGRAKSIYVNAPLPAGLHYTSHTLNRGNFNPATGTWLLDSLKKNESDTLEITATVKSLGNIRYTASIGCSSLEYDLSDNLDSLTIYGVSRPVALNDTLHFTAPFYQDYFVRSNDSDEDGGPFHTNSIIAGPYSGVATVINGDSIRYTISSGFTGTDSLRYVSCDNYPLCDTAWYFISVTSPLPVSLVNFSGSREDEKVSLSWITLNEKNNDRFEVERSLDGIHFEKRGNVKGAGTTNTVNHYSFKDTDDDNLLVYYRLIQVDYDGTETKSNSIALLKRRNNKFSAEIYPNPGDGNIQVIKAEGLTGILNLTISDLRGRIISSREWDPGTSGFLLEVFNTDIPLKPGCYLASFSSGDIKQTVKLLIR